MHPTTRKGDKKTIKKSIKVIGTIGVITILLCGIYCHVGKTFKSISVDIEELKRETDNIIDMGQVIDFKANGSGLMLYFADGNGYYLER